jgi:lysophospholipase L1-like esterase
VKAMPVLYVNSGDTCSATIRYVALGDSIAYGYGLDSREKDSYVGQVCAYLEEQYDSVILKNFACNGQQSKELLDMLTNPENENYRTSRATLQYADIVTISIGSNDLLHLLRLDLTTDIDELIQNSEPQLKEACENFAGIFPQIIKEILSINPDAKIYANNVYNPAKGLSDYARFYDIAEYYINYLNAAFYESDEYELIDVKKAFDSQKKSMVNMAFSGRQIDPHPSKAGHKLIGKMVIKAMAE